jgi:hypothetical protein
MVVFLAVFGLRPAVGLSTSPGTMHKTSAQEASLNLERVQTQTMTIYTEAKINLKISPKVYRGARPRKGHRDGLPGDCF